jgi:hypothetical protein
MLRSSHYIIFKILPVFFLVVGNNSNSIAQSQYSVNDTLIRSAVVYEGDTLESKVLAGVYVWGNANKMSAKAKWTRLRNAVYVTYPYAKKASVVFKDVNSRIIKMTDKTEISSYINSRERELKKEFTDPLTNLSVYQGKILMKLINRETGGNTCYDILKEMKGGFTARFWQTVAFVFGSNLKQPYDAAGADAEIEGIVKVVERMYGYRS